jgi:RNA polymerase sigma-70 factor (ECF subfamily)
MLMMHRLMERTFTHRDAAEAERRDRATALMICFCEGDDVAFAALYRLLAAPLRGWVLRRIGDPELADDLVQQTFIHAHRARGAFARGKDPLPWLFTIVRRLWLDEMRRRRRARRALGRYRAGEDLGTAVWEDPRAAAAEEGARVQRARAAREALEALPEGQRRALELTKLEGRRMAEAAAVLGTTPAAVKLRAHRAYATLRARLAQATEA